MKKLAYVLLFALGSCKGSSSGIINPINQSKSGSKILASLDTYSKIATCEDSNSRRTLKRSDSGGKSPWITEGYGEVAFKIESSGTLSIDASQINFGGDNSINPQELSDSRELVADGVIKVNISYNGINEVKRHNSEHYGKVYRLYAYSEGVVGKTERKDIIGLKLTPKNEENGSKSGNLTLKKEPLTLCAYRNLDDNSKSSTNTVPVEIAKWTIDSNSKNISTKFEMELTGIFGDDETKVDAPAGDYLGSINFYMVVENPNTQLNTTDVLTDQVSKFIGTYNIKGGDITNRPTNLSVTKFDTDPANLTKLKYQYTLSGTQYKEEAYLESGMLYNRYENIAAKVFRKTFFKRPFNLESKDFNLEFTHIDNSKDPAINITDRTIVFIKN